MSSSVHELGKFFGHASPCAHRFVTLKENDAASFVARSKIVTGVVELHGRDDVGLRYIFDITFVTKALGELPGGSSMIGFHHLSYHTQGALRLSDGTSTLNAPSFNWMIYL